MASTGSNTGPGGTRKVMTQRQVWAACVECIESFNSLTHTVDSHAAEYLAKHAGAKGAATRLDDDGEEFIRQVFYGCTRYKRMLDLCINSYLKVKHRMNDCFTPLTMVLYFAMHRLDEIGVAAFSSLVSGAASQNTTAEFLSFVFDRESAAQHVLPHWKEVFDDAYVDDHLASHIDAYSEDVLDLCVSLQGIAGSLEAKKLEKINARPAAKEATVAKPFSFAETKKRTTSVHPPPDTDGQKRRRYRRPADDEGVEHSEECIHKYKTSRKQAATLPPSVLEENRKKEAAIPFKPPQLTSSGRPNNLATIQQRVENEERVADRVPCRSVDEVRRRLARSPKEQPRITAAALLREEVVFLRQQQEAEEEMKKKIVQMRDDTEFREWQQRKQAEDEAAEKTLVRQRKVEMMLADEEARVARKREERKRARVAARVKVSIAEGVGRMQEEKARALDDNRAFVAKQTEMLEAARLRSLGQMREERVAKAKAVREEDQVLELKAAQNLELDMQRKAEIIRQIRAEERQRTTQVDEETGEVTRRQHRKEFDPDTTMGLGTLHEMSLTELRHALVEVRRTRGDAVARKRGEIEQARDGTKRAHNERLTEVLKRREERRSAGMTERELRQRDERAVRGEREAKERVRLQALQAKLQEKRDSRLAGEEDRREQERQRALDRQLQAADGGAIERKRWVEKERGLQNTCKLRQAQGFAEVRKTKARQDGEHAQRETWLESQIASTQRKRRDQDSSLRNDATLSSGYIEAEATAMRLSTATEVLHPAPPPLPVIIWADTTP